MSVDDIALEDVRDVQGEATVGRTVSLLLEDDQVLVARVTQLADGEYPCPESDCIRRFDSPKGVKTHVGKFHPELITKDCPECGEVFHPRPRSQKFCSQECRIDHQSNRVTLFCENCGRSFELKAAHADGRKHCSWECRKETNKEERVCPTCGGIFEVWPSETRKYCSRECWRERETQTSQVERTCPECSETFRVYPSNDQRFCSKDCYSASKWEIRRCPMCGDEYRSHANNEARAKDHCSAECNFEHRRADPRPDDPGTLIREIDDEDWDDETAIKRAHAHLGPGWSHDDVAAFYWLHEYRDFQQAAEEADLSPTRVLEVEARAVGAELVNGEELLELLETADARLEVQDALRVDRPAAKQFIAWIGMDDVFQERTTGLVRDLQEKTEAEPWPGVSD